MDKDQLISMIHFLEEHDKASAQENQKIKKLVEELTAARKVKLETQAKLIRNIECLTDQVADLTSLNKNLQQKANDLLSHVIDDQWIK